MFDIILLVIILLALAVIVFVITRKFPQIANLDVENLPEEQQIQKKKQILNKRIDDHSKEIQTAWKRRLSFVKIPFKKLWGQLQLRFRIYVGQIEKLWYHEQTVKKQTAPKVVITPEQQAHKLNSLIIEAEQSLKQNNLDKAEELFIAAITVDQKAVSAYRGLGDTYLAKSSLEEARQTYRFVLQLEPDDDAVMVKLAEVAESQGDLEEAIEYYQKAVLINDSLSPRFYHLAELLLKVGHAPVAKEAIIQAVELEPKNPKYLDLWIETAIICGERSVALKAYNELRLVNPENQKLEDFLDRINKM